MAEPTEKDALSLAMGDRANAIARSLDDPTYGGFTGLAVSGRPRVEMRRCVDLLRKTAVYCRACDDFLSGATDAEGFMRAIDEGVGLLRPILFTEDCPIGLDTPLDRIVAAVCEMYRLIPADLFSSGRERPLPEARGLACYIAVIHGKYKAGTISEQLGIGRPTVTVAVARTREMLRSNPGLEKRLEEILAGLVQKSKKPPRV